MRTVGITGIIGSGKTTVAKLLREKGFSVLDLDDIAKNVLSCKQVQDEIEGRLGREYIEQGRTIVEFLRDVVFVDQHKLQDLENIVHPKVKQILWNEVERLKQFGERIIFIDAPLLFEKGLDKELDKVVVVSAEMDTIEKRLIKRGLFREDIQRRISCQIPLKEKEKKADFIIFNSGTEKDLERNIELLLNRIREWEVTVDAS
jgi:dephospho-CoA kinase